MTYFFVFLQSIFYVKLIDTPYQIQGSCQNVCVNKYTIPKGQSNQYPAMIWALSVDA